MPNAHPPITIEGQTYNFTDIYFNGTKPASNRDCTLDTCSLLVAEFRYLPNLPGNIAIMAVFGLLLLINIPLGIYRKTWGILIAMICGLALEVAGYLGRVQAHSNPFTFNPFLIYIIALTIGPSFISAAIYLCLSRIVVVYGESNSRFKPATYSYVFMVSDLIALILQGAGGAIAAMNSGKDVDKSQQGINVMIAGLAWQVFSLTIFAIACIDFAWCLKKGRGMINGAFIDMRSTFKFKAFLWSLGIATVTIYIRSVYRVAELAQGFTGPIADAELPYMIFESAMIIIASVVLTVFHPTITWGENWQRADFRAGNKETAATAGQLEKGYYISAPSETYLVQQSRNGSF